MDLFAPPTDAEIQKRQEDRMKNCKHRWRQSKVERKYLLSDWSQVLVKDYCRDCNGERRIVLLLDENCKVIKDEIYIGEKSKETIEDEEQRRRDITECFKEVSHHGPF